MSFLWYLLAFCVILAGGIAGPLFLGWPGIIVAFVVCVPIAIVLIHRGLYRET